MSNDPERSARLIARERLHDGFITLDRLRLAIRSPAGEAEVTREVHSHGHVAALLPVDPARHMGTLVRQFRPAPFLEDEEAWTLEMPAGLLDHEPPQDCASREAGEETGLQVRELRSLGAIWPSAGSLVERIHLFWAAYDGPPPARHAGLEEEAEMIEVVELPLAEIRAMCIDGRIADAKTALAVLRLAALEPALFD